MNLDEIVNSMTPEVYQRLSTAVELGKWSDGVALTPEQKDNSLQLVMLWQARHNTDAQHMTIDTNGQMVMKSKQQLKIDFGITPEPIVTFKS
ncbi:YeaC family protein [Citrobacter farmeri]|uniref:YeaC family protein n=1 Tax=Citrobacter farmeri TaxID=67824 RepID=UPI00190714A3|nr:YeaC family protein [Citrobacter farmeri]EKV7296333.1 YeaC family protein [Citrobacter farmeri]MBJ8746250.1 YeaC family protein [Citrobacter farmeri]MBJ8759757.1 YeaC family protein [Citrobacter farmeri]MBJ9017053.1 YeaC family protein [Citrobacter farmeri]